MNQQRRRLEHVWRSVLLALDPAHLVRDELLGSNTPATIIAVGKAADAMAKGACEATNGKIRGLVITTDDAPVVDLPPSLQRLQASHPIPDDRSTNAAKQALQTAQQCDDEVLHVLVSGGTSSLLCAPVSLSLKQKQQVTDGLLRSGASISECNTVRRHLSKIKGGRLASACRKDVHCLVLSDVINGEAHDVGSGPACPDPTTIDDAVKVLRKYVPKPLASIAINACNESLKTTDVAAQRITHRILAGPTELAAQFANALRHNGWLVEQGASLGCRAQYLSDLLIHRAAKLREGEAWVVASEPTITVPANAGKGGRAGWVALQALASLPQDVILWAAASDGVDGNSGASGACVFGTMARQQQATIAAHLQGRDDGSWHAKNGSALRTGATGLNMTDVYAVLRPHGGLKP